MLGKAEPLAQPGSGFAFLVQQHPEHPAALVRQHPCHHLIPSAGRGTVPQPTVPLLTILRPPARQHQPGALQPLARTPCPVLGSLGRKDPRGRDVPQAPWSGLVTQQQKAGCNWEMDGDAQVCSSPSRSRCTKPPGPPSPPHTRPRRSPSQQPVCG